MKNTVITVTEPVLSVKKKTEWKMQRQRFTFIEIYEMDSNPMWVYTGSRYPDCLTCCFWWKWESMWLVTWIPEILLLLSLTLLTHKRESNRKHFWVEINIWYVLLYDPVHESTGCVTFKVHSVSQCVCEQLISGLDNLSGSPVSDPSTGSGGSERWHTPRWSV